MDYAMQIVPQHHEHVSISVIIWDSQVIIASVNGCYLASSSPVMPVKANVSWNTHGPELDVLKPGAMGSQQETKVVN